MNKSIAILTCWYGEYPWYFPYFIHSCVYNPSVDFIIITDNEVLIPNKPENVKIIYKTIEDIKTTASEKLGFSASLDYPYKLNDFKPAYGFIFPEILKNYDFWGHGDIDLVYGDIRYFLTEDILDQFDIVNSRHDYTTGAFCLFKNNKQINTLFMQSKDYKQILSSYEHFCFDECNFFYSLLSEGVSIFDCPNNIQSMTWVVKNAEREGKLKAYFDFIIIEGVPGHIKWDKGKIIYKNKCEAMFYHLVSFKVKSKRPKVYNPIPETFYFTPRKILI